MSLSDRLLVSVEETATLLLVRPHGPLDLGTVEAFTADVERLSGAGTPLTIDLEGLTFIDSIGIHALAKLAEAAAERGRPLTFGRATGHVQAALDAAGAYEYLSFEDGWRRT